MSYLKWFFGLITSIMFFILGRRSVINAQNAEVLKHVKKAKEIADRVRDLSDSDVDAELRQQKSDK